MTSVVKDAPVDMIAPVGQIWKTVSFRAKHAHTINDPAITSKRKTFQDLHECSSSVVHNCVKLQNPFTFIPSSERVKAHPGLKRMKSNSD